ncbi:MAG: hypothetical protein KIT09_21210 [Bryobacteraceae bacterium]|nr:hypothetical protein [Bryobacteraceae bacterium]
MTPPLGYRVPNATGPRRGWRLVLAAGLFAFAWEAVCQAPAPPEPQEPPQWKPARRPAPQPFVLPEASPPDVIFIPPPPPHIDPTPGVLPQRQSETLLGRSPDVAVAPPTAGAVIRAIIGLVGLMVLAYLGGHRRFQQIERRLNIGHMVTVGLPFVLLGLLASHPAVGVLTPDILRDVAPLLSLGLGWIGFVIGSRFDARTFEGLPAGVGTALLLTTALPIAAILLACGVALFLTGESVSTPGVMRDAFLLATAGAMTARSAPQFLAASGQNASARLMRIIEFEQLAGVFGLMLVSAYSRPPGATVAWHLPGTGWLFVILGIGTTMGIVVSATLTRINRDPQFTTVLLGAVAFTAGMASFLRLSPVSVCFIAGAIVINLAGAWREQVRHVLERLERPIYFLFLVIAGALWRPWEWQAWLLMVLFVASRVTSKRLSARLLGRYWIDDLNPDERRVLEKAPMGALSIAIVVTAQDLFFGPTVSWIVTAVIGGAIVMEAGLQLSLRGARRAAGPGAMVAEPPADREENRALRPG